MESARKKETRGYGFYVRSLGEGPRQTERSWAQEKPKAECELRPCDTCGEKIMVPVRIFANGHWVKVTGRVTCEKCGGKVAD